MTTVQIITTADQLLKAKDLGRCELVRGELHMMSPAGFRHSAIAARIVHLLSSHVNERRLGIVVAPDGGFLLERDPDTVRAPDAAFVKASRLSGSLHVGYFPARLTLPSRCSRRATQPAKCSPRPRNILTAASLRSGSSIRIAKQ